MKRLLTFVLIFVSLPFVGKAQIPVDFDEGVDLVALVWRLSGAEEYANCPVVPYAQSADEFFAPVKDHPAVQLARKYYNEAGVGYDAVASYGIHVDIDDNGRVVFDDDLVQEMDKRWTASMQAEFLEVLDDFYAKSRFHDWYVDTESYRKQAEDAFAGVSGMVDQSWFSSFFGSADSPSFSVKLCLLACNNNYGLSVTEKDGTKVLTPVISSASYVDGKIAYDINTVFPILVHEFCHSYCNPAVDAGWDGIKAKADKVFKANKSLLSSQAYPNARIMMYETYVRASVIRYMKEHFTAGQVNVEKLISDEEEKGFLLTRSLYEAMDGYKGDFSSLSDAVNGFDLKKFNDSRNEVKYKCNLKNKARNVPYGEFTFVMEFDRPMQNSVGINVTEYPFPELRGYEWSSDFRKFSVTFHLEAGAQYGFRIRSDAFVAQDGSHIAGREIVFSTKTSSRK